MKKLVITIIVAVLLVGGYYWIKKHGQLGLSFFKGETMRVHRGDLDVPITASGRIEPASITRIKGKASGEVIRLPFEVGKPVRRNDVIVEMDKSDEQRNKDRAQADYERAAIALDRAKIAEEEARKVGIPAALADLAQAEARLTYTQIEHTKKSVYKDDPNVLSRQEFETVDAQLKEVQAAVAAAKAKVTQAETAVRYSASDVKTMEQNLEVATKQLDDAKQRLAETTVLSPIDGMVLRRQVEIGEVVQSGKTSLTGGTVLIELADVSNIYAVVNVDEADIGLVRQLAPEDARPGVSTAPASVPAPAGSEKNPPTGVATSEPGEVALTRPAELPSGVIDTSQTVEVTVESFPGERFYGVIERIAPQSEISQAIATFRVQIRLTSPNRTELVGLLNVQAEAHFTAKSVRNALLVSYDAFQKNPNGEGFGVYVPVPDRKLGERKKEFRLCEFGRDNGIEVEVIKGLKEGDEVFTKLPIERSKNDDSD
jgi:HlyD family secretion protein